MKLTNLFFIIVVNTFFIQGCINLSFPEFLTSDSDSWLQNYDTDASNNQETSALDVTYPQTLDSFNYFYCLYDNMDIPVVKQSTRFFDIDFAHAYSFVALPNGMCDPFLPGYPEKAFLIFAKPGDQINARIKTNGWNSVLLLARKGCRYNNIVECSSKISATTTADKYFLLVKGDKDAVPDKFDLQIAINHTAGYDTCPVQKQIALSSFKNSVQNETDLCYQELVLSKTTALTPDNYHISCTAEQTDNDFGGGHDFAVKLINDISDIPQKIDIILHKTGAWDPRLIVTEAPCGKNKQVIACSDNSSEPETIDSLLLFQDQPIYIIIDSSVNLDKQKKAGGQFDLIIRLDNCLNLN